jgi:hypothetical protein
MLQDYSDDISMAGTNSNRYVFSKIMLITSQRLASMALRMTISFRIVTTIYEITPYSPIAASTAASTPKKPERAAIKRSRNNPFWIILSKA